MDTKTILSEASDRMQKTIEHLEEELLNIRARLACPDVSPVISYNFAS